MPKVSTQTERLHVEVHGAVQGVGFRPFVFRLAEDLKLLGWVKNTPAGVIVEVDGSHPSLQTFLDRLVAEKPPAAYIRSVDTRYLNPAGFDKFEIGDSDQSGPKTTVVLPDLATCPDCLRELFDSRDRRYRYPFINCTNCGPRYSIISGLPYDRPNTTMAQFSQCPACLEEYHNPRSRRFHAQPNACPICGPRLELWNVDGWTVGTADAALRRAAEAIRSGKIVAVKGLGGFQLIVDAANEEAVRELRRRKHREEKPFAVMYPAMKSLVEDCPISEAEACLLSGSQAPIVLLERKPGCSSLAASVAPENPAVGVMLPYTPLHHLLMHELRVPVVATSANLTDEPICIDEFEALDRLHGIADLFLVHNRPIIRHVDDSVVRVVMGRELVMRRARGYAPLPIEIDNQQGTTILAYGAHQKCAVALLANSQVTVSQHIGDMETRAAFRAHQRLTKDLPHLYDSVPTAVACDLHPDYSTTGFAQSSGLPVYPCQHHYAHVLSCMADNEIDGPVIGIAWDGTGYGTDGTIWGGEFLIVDERGFRRAGHLRPFLLPGGDHAVRQPRRPALALLYEVYGSDALAMKDLAPVESFSLMERSVIGAMIEKRLNCPSTTSAGRLFDAAASLVGLRQRAAYEGQAAMLLEYAALNASTDAAYDIDVTEDQTGTLVIDWRVTIEQLISDIRSGNSLADMAAKFHNALTDGIVDVAIQLRRSTGVDSVVLSGGCFQSKYLTEHTVQRLHLADLKPYWHRRIPPNDGGIAVGQAIAARRMMMQKG